jgi:broad specificity phosphatase PhoE
VPRVEIVLARHGETAWSRDRLHTSHTDLPLTDAGRQEAVALARRLKTCELVGLADEAEVDGDLREFDYGEFEGISTAEIRSKRPGWELWRDGCPGGETAADVGDRADRVIERALSTDGDVALFAHGHFLRVLGARWIGLPGAHGANLLLATAALCVLGFEREHRALSSWNDIGHLS